MFKYLVIGQLAAAAMMMTEGRGLTLAVAAGLAIGSLLFDMLKR